MNRIHYDPDRLREVFHRQPIATLPELKAAMGTEVDLTVFRKLAALDYTTSYSHRGAYYTLNSVARYDAQGLWSHQDVHFSRYGTLLETAAELTSRAPAGYFTEELEAVVQVPAKDALRQLVERGRLQRRPSPDRYLYGAAERARWQEQWAARQAQSDELPAEIALFYGLLDEQQRRLFAGLESLQHGHGGDRRMAELLGLDAATVARGRRELLAGEVLRERIRREGGGRKPVEKKRPK
ncbi:MAG: hypothetical protein Q7S40_10085 [Opitutaceae bacterium]|nr:hypothetical protein [Opitutaceae bacterium]